MAHNESDKTEWLNWTDGSVSKESAWNVGDLGSIPGSGRSPGVGNGNPLQYSCLENSMYNGVWWVTVHESISLSIYVCVCVCVCVYKYIAGSWHMKSHPWQGHEGENLTGKVDQVFRGFKKAGSWDPTHDKVTRRKPDRQAISGFQGFQKAAPSAHLKDGVCLSDACLNRLLPNFCDTGRRPSQISSQIRINLEL